MTDQDVPGIDPLVRAMMRRIDDIEELRRLASMGNYGEDTRRALKDAQRWLTRAMEFAMDTVDMT
ncbi:MAG: hypothetical protein LC798_15390 [Chloroflexi bacterium]|nr:hypothetical protein [Chloroflexota bacterium]